MISVPKRVLFFVLTNVLVLVLMGIVLNLLGFSGLLDQQGVDLNIDALLLFSAVFGFMGSFISLAMSKFFAKRGTGAQVIKKPRTEVEAWLLQTVERQAEQAGIGMPEVAIFPSPTPNAFATGMSRNNALVAVSVGLLERMNQDEVEAVLAHEISHVANGDMITLALMQGVVNTFVIFFSRVIGHTVDRLVFKTERGHGIGYWVTTIVADIVLGILASTLVMWYSRRREFRADAGAAKLTSPEKMISALNRLNQGASDLPTSMAAFGIRGKGGSGFKALWRSHPPIEARIAALQRTAA
jgi:heat shock protein HtpX